MSKKKSKPDPEPAEDLVFAGDWVYCSQHLTAHTMGWCTVSIEDKVGLGIWGSNSGALAKAFQKCERLGLHRYSGDSSDGFHPGGLFEIRDEHARTRHRKVRLLRRLLDGRWECGRILGGGRNAPTTFTYLSEKNLKRKWRKVRR